MVIRVGRALLKEVPGRIGVAGVCLRRQTRGGAGVFEHIDAEGRGTQRDLAAIDHRAWRKDSRTLSLGRKRNAHHQGDRQHHLKNAS
jgi:hypothetical protein